MTFWFLVSCNYSFVIIAWWVYEVLSNEACLSVHQSANLSDFDSYFQEQLLGFFNLLLHSEMKVTVNTTNHCIFSKIMMEKSWLGMCQNVISKIGIQ